jgi:hypothetical protein
MSFGMMQRIDLEAPRFTQAEVLAMAPELTAKTLQNWTSRNVLEAGERPGRQGKLRYTAMGVIALVFMAKLGRLGHSPAAAFHLFDEVSDRVDHLHSGYPATEDDGCLRWPIEASRLSEYARGYIFDKGGEPTIRIYPNDLALARFEMPSVYITVEVDILVLEMLGRIYAFLSGRPPVVTDGLPDEKAIREEHRRGARTRAIKLARLNNPGDEQ